MRLFHVIVCGGFSAVSWRVALGYRSICNFYESPLKIHPTLLCNLGRKYGSQSHTKDYQEWLKDRSDRGSAFEPLPSLIHGWIHHRYDKRWDGSIEFLKCCVSILFSIWLLIPQDISRIVALNPDSRLSIFWFLMNEGLLNRLLNNWLAGKNRPQLLPIMYSSIWTIIPWLKWRLELCLRALLLLVKVCVQVTQTFSGNFIFSLSLLVYNIWIIRYYSEVTLLTHIHNPSATQCCV